MSKLPAVPRQRITALTAGTRATTDQQLVDSWLRSLGSPTPSATSRPPPSGSSPLCR
jgi:hypothetical protein